MCNNILKPGDTVGICFTGNPVFTDRLSKVRKLFSEKNMPKGTMSNILILNVLITCHSFIDLFCLISLGISYYIGIWDEFEFVW